MSTSDAPASKTRLFNRTTQPRVLEWGAGVIMPGESFLTDDPESYAPDQPGSAWTVDVEAAGAILRQHQDPPANPSPSAPDGPSEPQVSPQGPNQDVPADLAVMPNPEHLTVESNGEVVDASGQVVGFVNPAADQAANTTQE